MPARDDGVAIGSSLTILSSFLSTLYSPIAICSLSDNPSILDEILPMGDNLSSSYLSNKSHARQYNEHRNRLLLKELVMMECVKLFFEKDWMQVKTSINLPNLYLNQLHEEILNLKKKVKKCKERKQAELFAMEKANKLLEWMFCNDKGELKSKSVELFDLDVETARMKCICNICT